MQNVGFTSRYTRLAPSHGRPVGLQENFQSLEISGPKLPRFGTFGRKTSKVWNFWTENFQGLELLREKLPNFGTGEKRSPELTGFIQFETFESLK